MRECPVCFDTIEDSEFLPCKHWVCRKCVVRSGKLKCPICRLNFTMSEQEYWYIQYLIRVENKSTRKGV